MKMDLVVSFLLSVNQFWC